MGTSDPSLLDLMFLVVFVPLGFAIRAEFDAHFGPRERREVASDVALIALALTAITFVLIRPTGADAVTSVSALVFASLAACLFAGFAGLVLWVPSTGHLLLFLAYVPLSLGLIAFGTDWVHGMFDGNSALVDVGLFISPIAVGAVMLLVDHGAAGDRPPTRFARPVLATASVLAATGAMIVIASVDDANGLEGAPSSVILVILGVALVVRVLVSQRSAAQDNEAVQRALDEREEALAQTDRALSRVREANETLRGSEEHLRLIFEAAVDGFVELDHEGTIDRANEAFCAMVGRDRASIEGTSWSTLAPTVAGADPAFADLTFGGTAMVQRPDGQYLYLESRVSKVPSSPARTLLLIRDVTAAKVADQTIRSLFQFLQDRDEDRTRLLRRMNGTIEQERNRIARDLHDGPVQGVSAASLSLEAALLMIKAGETEGGVDLLQRIRQELAGEADALRRLMANLRPPVLEERGLLPALRDSLAQFGSETGISTEFSGTVRVDLPDDLETLAYRVVQEALANVGRHAGASQVIVHIGADGDHVRIEIEDDGRGFDPGRARDYLRTGRVGLASMRERVELASGTFAIRSTPGRGTAVMATIPLDAAPVIATGV
jgi:PAS domain S-box-containing protein